MGTSKKPITEAAIQQLPMERKAVLVEGGSWEDRRVAVRIVQQEKYTDSYAYVLRGPRPEGGVYSSQVDESSYDPLQGTWGQDTLRPVTIKQVLDAQQPHPDAEFKIDDIEITQVTFVGQIRNISTQTTNITYKLDDGTGTIEVKQWIDADASTDMDPTGAAAPKGKLVENEWARVWGRLKAFNNRRHVGVHVIRPIEHKMDIMYHLLEATYVHLYFTRGGPEQFTDPGGAAGANGESYGQQNGMGGEMGMNGRVLPQMSVSAKKVYGALKNTPQSNEGLHVHNVAAQLSMPVQEVIKAGDELLGQSLIFTTVDDNTWAVLEF